MASESEALAGRVALVTGAGRGIGHAVARRLAASGAEVVLVARSAGEIEKTARAIIEEGGAARTVVADLGRRADVERVLAAVEGLGIGILVNNAATVDPLLPTTGLDAEALDAALALNVVAPALLGARLLPAMIENGWGRIVNVSSGVVSTPAGMVGANTYVTTKAALEGHTLNLAAELAGTGVTANVFRPGLVDTGMQESIRSRDPEEIGAGLHGWFVSIHEQGILATPEQAAAGLVDRLDSDATGEIWEPR